MSVPTPDQDLQHDEPPPILGTWLRLYSFILGYLAVLILAFWLFTLHYRPAT